MSKTQFIEGSILTPAFMSTSFGTTASTGHRHTELDADGSQPKINLTGAAEVTGLLPVSNIAGMVTKPFPVKLALSSGDVTADVQGTLQYESFGNRTTVFIPKLRGTAGASHQLRLYTDGTAWPHELQAWTDTETSTTQTIPATVINSTEELPVPALVTIPGWGSTQPWQFYSEFISTGTGNRFVKTDTTNFQSGTIGIACQSVTFRNSVGQY